MLFREIPEHRHTRQHHEDHNDHTDQRMMQLVNEHEIEQDGGGARVHGDLPTSLAA